MKFNFNDYKGKYVMHCKTEYEAVDFCRVMHESGRKWHFGGSYLDDNLWSRHQPDVYYYFDEGCLDDKESEIEEDYTVLEWSDFMGNKFTKAGLRSGDVVLRRDGSVEIVILETGTMLCERGGYNALKDIDEDLTFDGDIDADIVAVRRPINPGDCHFETFRHRCGELVYDRERDDSQVEEMTLEQVCQALGKNIKIIK